nr:PREDICTED: uncharacterized protein LOC103971084 isoform X1 [Musa acuminata subsp. malaccensis]
MMMIVWLILVSTTRNFRGNAFILLRGRCCVGVGRKLSEDPEWIQTAEVLRQRRKLVIQKCACDQLIVNVRRFLISCQMMVACISSRKMTRCACG